MLPDNTIHPGPNHFQIPMGKICFFRNKDEIRGERIFEILHFPFESKLTRIIKFRQMGREVSAS